MPPDIEPIAGGANIGVRDRVRWVPLSVSPSIASVDSTSASCPSLSDDASSTSSDSMPPSPPVQDEGLSFFRGLQNAEFMTRLFPHATKVADRIVPVQSHSSVWSLALFDEGETRTLYAKGASDRLNLRDNLVQLLDLADEELGCDQVVVVLDKADEAFSETLHSLLYVGGVVIPPSSASPLKQPSPDHVLVGIDV